MHLHLLIDPNIYHKPLVSFYQIYLQENFKEVIRDFSDHSDSFKNREFIEQCTAKLRYFDDLAISHQEMDRIDNGCKILEQEFDDYGEISDSSRVMALLTLKNCYWRMKGALRRYKYEGEKALEI